MLYRNLSLALVLAALLGTGCASSSTLGRDAQVEQFLVVMIDARDAALMSGDISTYSTFFAPSMWPSSDVRINEYDPQVLAGLRQRMREQDSDISSSSSSVEVIAVTSERDDLVVRYVVRTTLRFSLGGLEYHDAGQSEADYRATLSPHDGTFVITKLQLDNDEPEAAHAEASDTPGPEQLGLVSLARGTSTDRLSPVLLTYYSSAAASYADRYALMYNPAYRSFSADCTNFASQALVAGGRAQISGWYMSDSAWWYNVSPPWGAPGQSYTWAGARNLLANLVASRVGYCVGSSTTNSGDLIFCDWTSDGTADHTMIVSGRRSAGPATPTRPSLAARRTGPSIEFSS